MEEGMINSIEVSAHDPATVYVAFNRYKFDDFSPYVLKSIDFGKTWKVLSEGIEKNSFVRVVREDPAQRGLLYAGTERGIYLSINGGLSWFKWQRNLPIVPITDLKVHSNDLVVATQGRAFWIFDDLTPLHEYSTEMKTENVHMFDVEDNHKILFSAMRRQGPLGKNPYYGTEIKYFVRQISEEDSTELRIEIYNSSDEQIRSFSSSEELKSKTIDLSEGFNVMRWDGSVDGFVPPEGVMTPRGSEGYMGSYSVVPGKYSVKFKYGDYEKRSEFEIFPDPRQNTSKENFLSKRKFLEDIHNDIDAIYESLRKMQNARSQLKDLNNRLSSDDELSEIIKLSSSTIQLIDKTESRLISPKQKTFQDVINFRNQLDAQLYDLLSTVDQNIPPITSGESTRFDDLHAKWIDINSGYDIVVDNIGQINDLLIKKSVPFISKGKR